jgi:hypothetical protein
MNPRASGAVPAFVRVDTRSRQPCVILSTTTTGRRFEVVLLGIDNPSARS